VSYARPASLSEALQIKSDRPEAVPVAGGTDVMVEVNFGRRRPPLLLDLSRIEELKGWEASGDEIRVGAAVTYSEVCRELARVAPALALASRTVGSPQIRNRGTIGGNLGSASPAGDALPPLLATRATVELASPGERRQVPIAEFFTGPKRNTLRQDELIVSVRFPAARGAQQFAKIGPRNAMVIAVASFAIALWPDSRSVGTGLGSVAPTPRQAREAETFLGYELTSTGFWEHPHKLPTPVIEKFAQLVAMAADPIDDIRGTAVYRRHGLTVLAERALSWTTAEWAA
jgi:CO/xanthine dehydrogenase FAD-binding subunit